MKPADQVKQAAIEIANNLRARELNAQQELLKIEEQKLIQQAVFDAAKLSLERVSGFKADIGGDLQCPHCWVYSGKQIAMTNIPSVTRDDSFRCRDCQFEISIFH
jgi:hypothetical protein